MYDVDIGTWAEKDGGTFTNTPGLTVSSACGELQGFIYGKVEKKALSMGRSSKGFYL